MNECRDVGSFLILFSSLILMGGSTNLRVTHASLTTRFILLCLGVKKTSTT